MATNGWATVSYGGVIFDLRSTRGIRREMVFNENNTYLYTKWTFDFTSVYNPQATSYQSGIPPRASAGMSATITDVALRTYLSQPRMLLQYNFGTDVLLETPGISAATNSRYPCDADNGPIVEECSVIETYGVKTFLVHLRIVAVVNECNKQNPLLSNTWKADLDYDQDYYCIRIIEGTAVFRRDVLQGLNAWPDQYRQDLMFPVPPNMRREHIKIVAEEDGVTYRYQILDKEQGINLAPSTGGPVRFEGFFSSGFSQLGSAQAGLDYASKTARDIVESAIHAARNPWEIPGTIASFGASQALLAFDRETSRIPKLYAHCQVRCWGNYYSNRRTMMKWAIAVAVNRLSGGRNVLNPVASSEIVLTEQLNGQYVEVDITLKWPATNATDLAIGASIALINDASNIVKGMFGPPMPPAAPPNVNQNTDGLIQALSLIQEREDIFNNLSFPGDVVPQISRRPTLANPTIFAGRGNFWANLLAQALSSPCELPPAVPRPNNVPTTQPGRTPASAPPSFPTMTLYNQPQV